ncbi:MAG: hypothetical protein ACRDPL_05515, partial [Propionibacteriaceae bacterium]
VKRIAVDTAVYRYFEQVALDVEATRQTIANARDRKLTEIRALRADAEREVHKSEERLARVRRDYTDGELSVREWREFRDELQAEHAAAAAEADRLASQEQEVRAWGELRDAEADAWQRLTEFGLLSPVMSGTRTAWTVCAQRSAGPSSTSYYRGKRFGCTLSSSLTPD